jgi:hypothetical protein
LRALAKLKVEREHSPNRRIELARDLGLRSPDRRQDFGDVHSGDFVDGAIEQRPDIGRPEMPSPLIPYLRVRRLGLRVRNDELGDRAEGRERLLGLPDGLPSGFSRRQRVVARATKTRTSLAFFRASVRLTDA